MKFIQNNLLTLLTDNEKIYVIDVQNECRIALVFELPKNEVFNFFFFAFLLNIKRE